MLDNKWKQVEGFSNMGDDDESIFAKKVDGVTSIAFAAYGGLKIIEVTNIDDFGKFENTGVDFSVVISECGDDWEIAVPVIIGGVPVIIASDDNSMITVIPMEENEVITVATPDVVSSEEYDADECDDLEEDLLRLFHLV